MAFGEIARQLAQQTLLDQVTEKTAAPGPPDSVGAMMLGEIQAMQKACKEDEELQVVWSSGSETVRVLDVIVPDWPVMVLSGVDSAKNTTRVVAATESVQLVCKVFKVNPPAKPVRVNFRVLKRKSE